MDELKVTRSQDTSREGVSLGHVFWSPRPDYLDDLIDLIGFNRDCGVSKYVAWWKNWWDFLIDLF